MTLSLDIDDLLERVTYRCSLMTGIRRAFDYDEWPDSPPALPAQNSAYHLTGYLEDGPGALYTDRGSDMSEWELTIPLYTVVVDAAKVPPVVPDVGSTPYGVTEPVSVYVVTAPTVAINFWAPVVRP